MTSREMCAATTAISAAAVSTSAARFGQAGQRDSD
jgi:hypothetical protein